MSMYVEYGNKSRTYSIPLHPFKWWQTEIQIIFWHSVYILYNYCTFDSKMLATFNYQLCQCNFKIVLNLGEFFKTFFVDNS